jgi:uncharacterized Fe-S cluster-containing radical SAM superfamily protein
MDWPVVPVSEFQQLDIHSEDLLFGNNFRRCNTIRAKKGQDKINEITLKRFGKEYYNQFIVQLFGCPLKCWYCYVTPDGIKSKPNWYTTEELVDLFLKSGCDTFHLMGGAPALYYENWIEIAKLIPKDKLFHSDFLLIEKHYHTMYLKELSEVENAIYSLSIKGTSSKDFKKNTGHELNETRFYENLSNIINSKLNYYVTFTNPNEKELPQMLEFLSKFGVDLDQWFSILPVHYKAIEAYKNSK